MVITFTDKISGDVRHLSREAAVEEVLSFSANWTEGDRHVLAEALPDFSAAFYRRMFNARIIVFQDAEGCDIGWLSAGSLHYAGGVLRLSNSTGAMPAGSDAAAPRPTATCPACQLVLPATGICDCGGS